MEPPRRRDMLSRLRIPRRTTRNTQTQPPPKEVQMELIDNLQGSQLADDTQALIDHIFTAWSTGRYESAAMSIVKLKNMSPQIDTLLRHNYATRVASDIPHHLSFKAAGIPLGSMLVYTRDPSIRAQTQDDKLQVAIILSDNKEYPAAVRAIAAPTLHSISIHAATKVLFAGLKVSNTRKNWTFNGQRLDVLMKQHILDNNGHPVIDE